MTALELGPFKDPESFPRRERRWLEYGDEEITELLVEWFFLNFEDPAQHTPYDSAEGGYQYVWGGPYDAREQLNSRFSHVASYEAIEAAIEQIEQDGEDWVPHQGRLIEVSEEDDDPSEGVTTDGAARADVSNRLDALEATLKPYLIRGIGDNNPPEPIDDFPLSHSDLEEVHEAIVGTRAQLLIVAPDTSALRKYATAIQRAGSKVGLWLLDLAKKVATSAAVAASVTAATIATTDYMSPPPPPDGFLLRLNEAAESILNWISLLV